MIVRNPENSVYIPDKFTGIRMGEEEMDLAVAQWQKGQLAKGSNVKSFFEGVRDYINEQEITVQTPRSTVTWDKGKLLIVHPEKQVSVTKDIPRSQLPNFKVPDFLQQQQVKNLTPIALGAIAIILLLRK